MQKNCVVCVVGIGVLIFDELPISEEYLMTDDGKGKVRIWRRLAARTKFCVWGFVVFCSRCWTPFCNYFCRCVCVCVCVCVHALTCVHAYVCGACTALCWDLQQHGFQWCRTYHVMRATWWITLYALHVTYSITDCQHIFIFSNSQCVCFMKWSSFVISEILN